MVTKLENAVCFGKLMITQRPLIVQDFAELLSEVKYHSLDVPLQRQIQLDEQQQGTLPERIDEGIGIKLEVEFNELYNILRSPAALRDSGFGSKFGLVTPEGNLNLYNDVYMT